jgi:hypothetical protein
MLRHLITALTLTFLLASCTPSAQKKAAEIDKLETAIKENAVKNIADTGHVKILIADYKSYATQFPSDTLSAVYLMKAARFYDFIKLPDSAIYFYNQVATSFPAYAKCDLALFSEAFIYENEKHNLVIAGELYRQYLNKYPQGQLAKSVTFELHNLGKTPGQIMAEMDSAKHAPAAHSSAPVQ